MTAIEILSIIFGGGAAAALFNRIGDIVILKINSKAKKEDDETEHEKRTKKALRVILYDRVKHLCRRHIDEGYITADDLEDLIGMHQCYHDDLDGNGFLDSMMAQAKALPVRNRRET